jgi:hypothetical protein
MSSVDEIPAIVTAGRVFRGVQLSLRMEQRQRAVAMSVDVSSAR